MLFLGIEEVICKKSCDSFFRDYHWILGQTNLSHLKWCQNHRFCHPMWGNSWDLVLLPSFLVTDKTRQEHSLKLWCSWRMRGAVPFFLSSVVFFAEDLVFWSVQMLVCIRYNSVCYHIHKFRPPIVWSTN